MLCVRNRKGVDGWGVVGGKEWRGKRRSPGRAPLFAGRRSGRYSTRSRGAHNVSLCAPLQGTGLGRADPQKGPKGAGPVARVLEQYQSMFSQLRLMGHGRRIHRKDPKGGAAATLIPRYSPRENMPWRQTLGQYGTGFQGPVRFPLACSAPPGAAPASRRASRRLG